MLHEFLSAVTDELLSYTEAETEEDIKCKDIVTVVTNKLNSCGVDCDDEYGQKLADMISLILYRIITKDMRLPQEGLDLNMSVMLDRVEVYTHWVPRLFSLLYDHWRELPLDVNDVRILKKYFYPKKSIDSSWGFIHKYFQKSFFYIGSLGINYEPNFDNSDLKPLAIRALGTKGTHIDEKGVLTLNLNKTLFFWSIWYKSVIISGVQMKNIVHAIWRRVLYEFLDQGLKISSVKISPYAINARGATQKTIEDNFSIQIDGHSYTVSEFIDVLSAEFTRLLTSSKSAVIANKRNLTQSKTLR